MAAALEEVPEVLVGYWRGGVLVLVRDLCTCMCPMHMRLVRPHHDLDTQVPC